MKRFLFILFFCLLMHLANAAPVKPLNKEFIRLAYGDTIPPPKKEIQEKKDNNASQQAAPQGKAIKEVPRAKNQAKPKMVTPPGIKMKPIKVIKPKINGKGLGR